METVGIPALADRCPGLLLHPVHHSQRVSHPHASFQIKAWKNVLFQATMVTDSWTANPEKCSISNLRAEFVLPKRGIGTGSGPQQREGAILGSRLPQPVSSQFTLLLQSCLYVGWEGLLCHVDCSLFFVSTLCTKEAALAARVCPDLRKTYRLQASCAWCSFDPWIADAAGGNPFGQGEELHAKAVVHCSCGSSEYSSHRQWAACWAHKTWTCITAFLAFFFLILKEALTWNDTTNQPVLLMLS